jgi:C4-dicarboxylate-specific signal transduction histidine kinase
VDRLRADQDRVAMAMESSRLGVWDWNVTTGKVLYAMYRGYEPINPAIPTEGFPHWTEVDASEWTASTHPDDVSAMQPAVEAALAGPAESIAMVYRRRRADNARWEWIESQGRVVARGPSGRASRLVGTMSVATTRLREEAERRHLEQAFFQNIRLSTVAEVASGLSHEVNQPLTAAMMHAQEAQRLLGRRALSNREALRALDAAVFAIERAAGIARRHRQPVRRPGAGWKRFDLLAAARRVVELLKPDARAAGVAIIVRCRRRSFLVDGDPVQVEQVIANLVRNAIEAIAGADTDRRSIRLSVDCVDRVARVRVADTGPGVAPDVRDSLFLPYVTTKPDGTGLGLALSRTIAEAHGGRLVVENGRRGETVFRFEWPIRRATGQHTTGQQGE